MTSANKAILTLCMLTTGSLASATTARDSKSSPELAQQAMEDFAACTLKSKARRQAAIALTKMEPRRPRYTKHANALVKGECIPRGVAAMTFQPDALRLAIFTGLYRRDFNARPILSVEHYAPLTVSSEIENPKEEANVVFVSIREVTDCVARSKPLEVHNLLMANVMSPDEGKIWPPLIAELVKCNRTTTEFKMQKVTMRGMLAEALYKIRTIYAPSLEGGRASDA